MPAARARTSASRLASKRPGNSLAISTLEGCTVNTETVGGGGVWPAAALPSPPPQAANEALTIKAKRLVLNRCDDGLISGWVCADDMLGIPSY